MVMNEIDRLTGKDRVLNFVCRDEIPTAVCAPWQASERTPPASSKVRPLASTFDDEVSKSWICEEIIGPSGDLRRIGIGLQVIAQTGSPVLILGKTGTCKEVIARSLHALSHYSNLPFIHVNCQLARPEEILAALTEKTAQEGPRHHAAHGGCHLAAARTIFLEEVSKLSPATQREILKALHLTEGKSQDSESVAPEHIRLIASSDFNLLDATKMGSFSNVLYQYLKTHLIAIPALRDRAEDMPMLVQRFLEQHSRDQGRPCRSLSANAVELLQLYPWPGNLRELWYVMARFVALREAGQIQYESKRPQGNKPSLCRHSEEVTEPAEIDECELIVTSLLQTIALRSQELSAVL